MQIYLYPLLGGILIGLASWLVLASLGRVTGISGILSASLFHNDDSAKAQRAWRIAFVLGLMLGGALFTIYFVPPSMTPRSPWLLAVSGLMVGFGTVLGSGCTSGHGVCGLGRRSMRSFTATGVFMGIGMITVYVVARLNGDV